MKSKQSRSMDEHIYKDFWYIHAVGRLLNFTFIKYDKTKNMLCEIDGLEKIVRLIILYVCAIWFAVDGIYHIMSLKNFSKVEFVTLLALPCFLWNLICALRFVHNYQKKLINVLNSLQRLNEILSNLHNSKKTNEMKTYVKLLHVTHILLTTVVVIIVYNYILKPEAKIYTLDAISCGLPLLYAINSTTCILISAQQVYVLYKICKQFVRKRVTKTFCVLCNHSPHGLNNDLCIDHQVQ